MGGFDQQADQHGVLRLLCLSLHVVLLLSRRPSAAWVCLPLRQGGGGGEGARMKLMAYQSKRGGRCVFQDIAKPVTMEWGTCLEAMEAALELEKTVNESLLELTKCANAKGDSHLSDFIDEFLEDQVASIKSIGDTITKLKRVGDGLGLFLFDKEMAA